MYLPQRVKTSIKRVKVGLRLTLSYDIKTYNGIDGLSQEVSTRNLEYDVAT